MSENLVSMEQILREIKAQKGEDVLLYKDRTLAIFSDLSGNQLKAQRNCLGIFMDCQGPRCIFDLRSADDMTRQIRFGHLVQKMRDEYLMQEAVALDVCNTFWRVVFDTSAPHYSLKEIPSQTHERAPKTVKKANKETINVTSKMVAQRQIQETADAQYQKGLSFYYKCNYSEAMAWLRKAADQGHAAAQNLLGVCYLDGYAVPVDRSEAAKWFLKSAEQGEAAACYNLAGCYQVGGDNLITDYAEAAKWYKKYEELSK